MTVDNKKLIKFVSKLSQMTQDNELRWASVEPLPHHDNGLRNPAIMSFTATLQGKTLRLTRTNVAITAAGVTWGPTAAKLPTQQTIFVLEMYSDGNLILEFPQIQGVSDLFESVTSQAANVDEFIDDVLRDE